MSQWTKVVAVCGNGSSGQLGLGLQCLKGIQSFHIIAPLQNVSAAKQVACGAAHTCVVTENGSLYTFGLNDKGQLGHSEKEKYVAVPIEVGLPDPVVQVAAGENHTVCLTESGEVWAWGSHESGQLGIGSTGNDVVHKIPRLVKELSGVGVQQIACGAQHNLAVGDRGKGVWVWGSSSFGALGFHAGRTGSPYGGYYAPVAQRIPRRIDFLPQSARVAQVSCGDNTSGVVDDSGNVWTWGYGTFWNLGHGADKNEFLPRQVQSLSRVRSLAMGSKGGFAARQDGSVFAWGTDENGSLGQGEEATYSRLPVKEPKRLALLPRCLSVATGWKHGMAVTEDSQLYSWGWCGAYYADSWSQGDAGAGQLGLGDGKDHWTPAQVMRIHTTAARFYDLRMPFVKPWKALQVSCGRNHSAGIFSVHLDMRDLMD